jgi:hypothetical protein
MNPLHLHVVAAVCITIGVMFVMMLVSGCTPPVCEYAWPTVRCLEVGR